MFPVEPVRAPHTEDLLFGDASAVLERLLVDDAPLPASSRLSLSMPGSGLPGGMVIAEPLLHTPSAADTETDTGCETQGDQNDSGGSSTRHPTGRPARCACAVGG